VVCVGFAAAGAAQGGPPGTVAALQIVAGANGSGLDAAVLRATAADLAAKSPTFRQMLATVGNAERLLVVIRPVGSTRGLGEGRFMVDRGVTVGRLTVGAHRDNPTLRVRALAHELGHATEVACLPRQADTEELRRLITFRAGQDGWRGPVDTPFADAIERVILREFARNSRKSGTNGRLGILAAAHALPLCASSREEADIVPVRTARSQR
jgi:hypothetical protein